MIQTNSALINLGRFRFDYLAPVKHFLIYDALFSNQIYSASQIIERLRVVPTGGMRHEKITIFRNDFYSNAGF
jgi:hypothetical protein